jgi:outer membrane receptor for ferrienterochelin and colicin
MIFEPKYKIIIILFLLISTQEAYNQHFSISGYVEDSSSGERIIGAYVSDSVTKSTVQTNNYGFFNLRIIGKKAAIRATYIGFRSEMIHLQSGSDTVINIKMKPIMELNEVIITSSSYKHEVNSPPGLIIIPVNKLTSLPSLGEADLLKSIQYQPGIKGGMEGSTGVFVRGGGQGENLFMLDDIPLYNVSHLYGFFSSFNNSAIKDIKLIKGSFPARYGGRASSIIDVRSRDGNNKNMKCELSIGFVSSKMLLEGPLINEKTTFFISGRRSYFDAYSNALKRMNILSHDFPKYYFYDLNARIAHTFTQRDKIFLSFYSGKDRISNKNKVTFENFKSETYSDADNQTSGWGNLTGSFRWNHAFRKNLFVNTTVAFSRYDYYVLREHNSIYIDTSMNHSEINYYADYKSGISDFIFKADFNYSVNNNNKIFAGFGNTFHRINPGINKYKMFEHDYNQYFDTLYSEIEKSYINDILNFSEFHFYIEDEITIFEKLFINPGFRISGLVLAGQSKIKFEPRLSAVYTLGPKLAFKAGYSRMTQYFHLLTTSGLSSPTDIWVPSLKGLKPLASDQINACISYEWADKILLSIELYQKWLNHSTDYQNGASLFTDLIPWYKKTTQGFGRNKGLEISLEKQSGRFTGSLNYTLSKAERQYKDLNNGLSFPFKYDRLHDFNISLNAQISKKWDATLLWTFGTGYPVTIPVEKYYPALNLIYDIQFNLIYYYPSLNNYRLSAYHRLDIGVHYKTRNRLGEHLLSIDIFNAYDHRNPVNMYFIQNVAFQSVYLLPIIPSISYTLKFNCFSIQNKQ